MKLTEYPTPESDSHTFEITVATGSYQAVVPAGVARDLEQKLRKCRGFLSGLMACMEYTGQSGSAARIRSTLEETE